MKYAIAALMLAVLLGSVASVWAQAKAPCCRTKAKCCQAKAACCQKK